MAFNPTAAFTISWFYAAAFGRTPVPNSELPDNGDLGGLTFWTDAYLAGDGDLAQYNGNVYAIADFFVQSPEFLAIYPETLTNAQYVTALYNNMLGRAPDFEGLEFWLDQLDQGASRGQVLADFTNTPENQDSNPARKAAIESFIIFIANDDDGTITPEEADVWLAANPNLDGAVVDGLAPLPPVPADFTLTVGPDNLVGTTGDNTFFGPLAQNDLGAVTNTFESGDVLDGAGGRNTLTADLTTVVSGTIPIGPAISATTANIQEVFLRSQFRNDEAFLVDNNVLIGFGFAVNHATIDAERMRGVEQWWSSNSRADIVIEDVRSAPETTFAGMRSTDPGVSYAVLYDPLFLQGFREETDSRLTITLQNLLDLPSELADISVREMSFTFEGENYILSSADLAAANTWNAFQTALEAALSEVPALSAFTVTQQPNGIFVVTDPAGGSFQGDGELVVATSANIDLRARAIPGEPEPVEGPIETNIVLDSVGRTSEGGVMVVGSMSTRGGVEVFNVTVDNSSWLQTLASTNNALEEVYVTGDNGTLFLGAGTETQADLNPNLRVPTYTDNRLATGSNQGLNPGTALNLRGGLTDVRVFDATGFTGNNPNSAYNLMVGASITNAVFTKYLTGVQEPVQFQYLLGDSGANLSLFVNNQVSGDPDFALEIVGGAGDDRINLTGLAVKNSTSIDGGAGANIVEVDSSTGNIPETAFAEFQNIQTLVVRNSQNTVQNVVVGNMPGLSNIVVASTAAWNTELRQVNVNNTSITLSGKNQTLGDASNANQFLGVIAINGSTGQEANVLLDNTARVNGVFTIAALNVGDFGALQSAIRTLNLESGGARDTSNIVQSFSGPRVTTLNLEGTQDLAIHVANMATLPVTAGQTPPMTIDGSTLEGNLTLALNAANLLRGDQDRITGTAGANDLLAMYGAFDGDNPTVRGFETVQFGWLAGSDLANTFNAGPLAAFGTYNATNTQDVGNYVIGLMTAAGLTLDNLRSGVTVTLGDEDGPAPVRIGNTQQLGQNLATNVNPGGVPIILSGPGTAGSTLQINSLAQISWQNFLPVGANPWGHVLDVRGFTNVNVNIERPSDALSVGDTNIFFPGVGLRSFDPNNTSSGRLRSELLTDDAVRTLTITGGDANPNNFVRLELTAPLNTALTRVDVSGFEGEFFAREGWSGLTGSNATIVVNGYDFLFDVGGDITQFTVPGGGGADVPEVQTLDFNAAAFGDLAVGASITISFAGANYFFTNTTANPIAQANINAAIIADAASAPTAFTITDIGGLVGLTATTPGNMAPAVVYASANPVAGNVAIVEVTAGDRLGSEFALITTPSEFITTFQFAADANERGVVWQIDNFQAFGAGTNVGLGNQSLIDLRDLGVDSVTDIQVRNAEVWYNSLNPATQALFDAASFTANDTVVVSNEGLNYTILLTGVDTNALSNENFVGIA